MWGTCVNPDKVRNALYSFLENFEENNTFYYQDKISSLAEEGKITLEVNVDHIRKWDSVVTQPEGVYSIFNNIVCFPMETIPLFDQAIELLYNEVSQNKDLPKIDTFVVKLVNLRNYRNIRELGPADIDTCVTARGIVVRVSEIVPDLKIVVY